MAAINWLSLRMLEPTLQSTNIEVRINPLKFGKLVLRCFLTNNLIFCRYLLSMFEENSLNRKFEGI